MTNLRIFHHTIIMLIGLYVLELAATGGLAFYIHPRYFLVTTIAAVVCAAVGFAGVVYEIQQADTIKGKIKFRLSQLLELVSNRQFLNVFTVLVVLFALVFPPRALSSRAASQRESASNIVLAEDSTAVSRFVSQRDKYGIAEWVAELNRQPDYTKYVGEEVNLDGLVFVPEGSPENVFNVSRFVVRCCVVDASPLGLTVVSDDWRDRFEPSDWVRVKGKFDIQEIDGQQVLVIIADDVSAEEVPDYPYIY